MSLNEKRGRGCKHEVGKCFEIIPIPNGDSSYLTKVGKFCAVSKDSNVKKGHLGILRAQIDPSQVFATHCNHKQGEKGKQNTLINTASAESYLSIFDVLKGQV